jgi:trehalose 6-phosphate synthase/phosphatase
MVQHRFIVVSNRLPVTVTKVDGKLTYQSSSGGLATAMSSIETEQGMLWVGWPGINSDELTPADKTAIIKKLKEYDCYPVFLSAAQIENFYEGYSNETIWPLFHYFQSLAQFKDEHWRAYKEVNNLFAKTIAKLAVRDATIWVHDYHLMLLPKLLRQKSDDLSIGFFLHIPFPSFEIFRLIPQRKELLEGLLGADLVGFHIHDYVRHFSSSVMRTLGFESQGNNIFYGARSVRTDSFPIGIDYEKFRAAISSPSVRDEIKLLNDHYNGKKIILSVDRLDYSKGIAHRLEAYEEFLRQYPEYHKKIVLVVIAVPSRTEVEAYKELRDGIEQTVSRINGTYASIDWVPVAYQFQNQPFDKLIALYAKSAVALVTPVRDGMNLVAKEYVAARHDDGVLILSELTGAVDELPEALVINPNDRQSIVNAVRRALSMPKKQQKSRINAMQRRISSYSVQKWAKDFLQELAAAKHFEWTRHKKVIDLDAKKNIKEAYDGATKRLIVLDYDGTLRDFVRTPKPGDAKPGRALLRVLSHLSGDRCNEIYIVSGRERGALDSWFGHLPITLIAEHGYWTKKNGKWTSHDVDIAAYKSLIMPVMLHYTERTPGAVLEDKTSSLVWHYKNVSPELAYLRRQDLKRELRELLTDSQAAVHSGHKILEVKPKVVGKHTAIRTIIKKPHDFILCCGDDYTDEDMFRELSDNPVAFTIKVGLGETIAKQQVRSVDEMLSLLKML